MSTTPDPSPSPRDLLREQLATVLPHALVDLPDNLPELIRTADVVVHADALPEVVRLVIDQLGYGLLSDIAAVDYVEHGLFELVYRFYSIGGGGDLVVKVRVPREQPDVPSLLPILPGAMLHEREAYDLFGIRFIGHPDLRRIYMWDEFEGFPMRKDFPKQGDNYIGEGA